ncbi:MAG: response regulator [Desulfobacterales bacterium]|nr:response regulator [Desulfobacterales bacterium]
MNATTHKPWEADVQIVDDNHENLAILASILKKKGHDARLAINPELALKSILSDPPDLILLDIMMPGMDGYELCERLKADERTRDIPVIFISALNETMDKVRAFSAGGVDYITKPFQEEEVLMRVETHLTLRTLQKELEEKNALLKEKNHQLGENNAQLEEKNAQLEEALAKVQTLGELLPICSKCKKIRDGQGYWNQIEAYIESHSNTEFSHGLCDECMEKLYGDQEWYRKSRGKR